MIAVVVAFALVGAAGLAAAGRSAETTAARRVPALAALGPGKLGLLRSIEVDKNGQVPAGIAAAARRALPGSPLASEPFFGVAAAGFRGTAAGTPQDAALLREAVRRNPRSREARLLLMRHAVAAGNLGEAIDQLAVLNRLNSSAVEQLMAALGAAISTDRQVDEAVAALQSHRELYRPFIGGFAQTKKPPALIVHLISSLPPVAFEDPESRRLAIIQMINAQAFAQARALWQVRYRSATPGLVHSPDFADRTSPPPFNWALEQNSTGVAERVAGKGIELEYYGRESGLIASQLVTLAPGNYRAILDYRTESGAPGGIAMQLRCADTGDVLAQTPLRAAPGTGQKLALRFTILPTQCRGQVLALVGLPLEERNSQAIVARTLTIEPGAAS